MRKRIYIAGPVTGGDRVDNLAQAVKAFRTLAEKGFAPYCPHFSMLLEGSLPTVAYKDWLEVQLPWVEKADAVLRLPGESPGAEIELLHARRLNIPIYRNAGRLIEELAT